MLVMHINSDLKMAAVGTSAIAEENRVVSEEILALTGAQKPRVLFIATPRPTETAFNEYVAKLTSHFGGLMGANTVNLHEFDTPPSELELTEKVGSADAIFVSGGNTKKMMKFWKQHGIDTVLNKALSEGKVMSGGSAGAIAWFEGGFSDSLSYEVPEGEPWDYIYVRGLGHIAAVVNPHNDSDELVNGKLRTQAFRTFMDKHSDEHPEIGLGIDNGAALFVVNGLYKVISFRPGGGVTTLISDASGALQSTQLPILSDYQLLPDQF